MLRTVLSDKILKAFARAIFPAVLADTNLQALPVHKFPEIPDNHRDTYRNRPTFIATGV